MSKSEKSKVFFDNPKNYLKSNVIIYLRKIIISEILGKISKKKIIDIGCGNGELSIDFVKENHVTFLDISTNMLSLVKNKIQKENMYNASFVNSDFLLYSAEKKFDVIICIGVIAHVENVNELFKKLYSIVNDDGLIILQYTAAEKFFSKFNRIKNILFNKNKYDYKTNVTTSSEINKIINKENLKIIKKIKYIPISPFLSFFKSKTKLKFLKLSYKNKYFSLLGSEIIICLKKENTLTK